MDTDMIVNGSHSPTKCFSSYFAHHLARVPVCNDITMNHIVIYLQFTPTPTLLAPPHAYH